MLLVTGRTHDSSHKAPGAQSWSEYLENFITLIPENMEVKNGSWTLVVLLLFPPIFPPSHLTACQANGRE